MVAVAKKRERKSTGFGQRLRELRLAQGLTQTELANRVDVLYQAVQQIELGKVEPNWPTVLKLADALGVSLDEFRAVPGAEADDPPRRGRPKKSDRPSDPDPS